MASDPLAMPRHQSVTGASRINQGHAMNLAEHLQPLPTDLLKAMAKCEVDTQAIAAQLMTERGLDRDGKWVGFANAAEAWRLKP